MVLKILKISTIQDGVPGIFDWVGAGVGMKGARWISHHGPWSDLLFVICYHGVICNCKVLLSFGDILVFSWILPR